MGVQHKELGMRMKRCKIMRLQIGDNLYNGVWNNENRTFRLNAGDQPAAPPVDVVVNAHVSIIDKHGIPVTGGSITAVNIVNNKVEVVIA